MLAPAALFLGLTSQALPRSGGTPSATAGQGRPAFSRTAATFAGERSRRTTSPELPQSGRSFESASITTGWFSSAPVYIKGPGGARRAAAIRPRGYSQAGSTVAGQTCFKSASANRSTHQGFKERQRRADHAAARTLAPTSNNVVIALASLRRVCYFQERTNNPGPACVSRRRQLRSLTFPARRG